METYSYIYALTSISGDLSPLKVRYIGQTKLDLGKRLYYHIKNSVKYSHHCANWIQSLLRLGITPEIHLIITVESQYANLMEIEIIKLYRGLGSNLCNLTDGGIGLVNPQKEVTDKISKSAKGRIAWNKGKIGCQVAWNKGIPLSIKARENISVKLTGNKNCLGRKASQESRDNMSLSHVGHKVTQEIKDKISIGMFSYHKNKRADTLAI